MIKVAKSPSVCVIGAGPSGMVAAKILQERGLPFQCFEKGSDVGGLWRINNDSGTSAAYESLHINSSRQLMAFSDFAMQPHLPDFPHHSDVLKYFEDYADHFQLRKKITFQTAVTKVSVQEDGTYHVSAEGQNGEIRSHQFDAVIVANGHHWSPKLPSFKGRFEGRLIHSHEFKSATPFAGQSVLVVGIGNSGVDIACELSRVASKTMLSTRRGAHVIPKYLLGKPLDRVAPPFFWKYCPMWLRQRLFALLLKMTRGRQTRYGMPEPDYRVLQEHPTVSSELLNLLGHGKLQIQPDIESLQPNGAKFVDGSCHRFDTIICATGYEIKFPFLAEAIVNPIGNEVGLYRKVVHPSQPGLFFVGLVQPWGPLMPLAEQQSEWVADLLTGVARLPHPDRMKREIENSQKRMEKRYVKSSRHTIQVDFYPYLDEIKKARRQKQGIHAMALPATSELPAESGAPNNSSGSNSRPSERAA